MSSQNELSYSFVKVHAPKPIRSMAFNRITSIKTYSKTPMMSNASNNILLQEQTDFSLNKNNLSKYPSIEIDLDQVSLDEIEKDFTLFKTQNEVTSSNDEILKILNTPKTLSQSLRFFEHKTNDNKDLGIERAKNPIYKAIEGQIPD